MRLVCNISPQLFPIPQSPTSNFPPFIPNWTRKTLIGALSFGLLIFSPSSLALQSPSSLQFPPEYCREHDFEDRAETDPDSVLTNEGIVEEAWEIVNDCFLDACRRRWSLETWQRKQRI